MNVFKLALKVASRHWHYLVIYVVAFGAIALVGSGALTAPASDEFQDDAPKVAVIDRDDTAISAAIGERALTDAEPVSVEDSTFGLQDAAAKDLASYVLIIPEGFEHGFLEAARTGEDAPALETVVSYQNARGALVDERVRAYAQSLYGFAATGAGDDVEDVVLAANEACGDETPVGFATVASKGIPSSYLNYAAFSSYALFAAPSIFIAAGLAALQRTEVRRRLTAGPVPSGRYGLQVLLACVVFSLFVWVIVAVAGLIAMRPLASGAPMEGVVVVLAAQLAFAFVGGAVGFLLWQVGASDSMANGVGNIVGLVCSFFSGAWIPLSIMGEGVRIAASFTPFFWATNAMMVIAEAPSVTGEILAQAAGEVGMTFLWAVVVGALAVALGRIRLRERGA